MSQDEYKVFVSHGSHDSWVAAQTARAVREAGAEAQRLVREWKPKGE